MASSSSSSNFNSVSDSHSWKYEVFVSFRGEDTRKGFVDHLYKALVQQGILTYKDDVTLPRGATIGPALIKAIHESRIAVIVFSENYANSSWCLDELAHIVECMENKGQIVLPVFYNVDPSDVRKQKRKYGEAFAEHECENAHKVKVWREALAKAGNLSGWVSKEFANGHEAECIEDIVAKILAKLPLLIESVNIDLIGITSRLRNLKSMLKIGAGGVRMVGIWGVGGAGKTTLASVAYMELSPHFEAACLLENIREKSSKRGLEELQAKMLSVVLKRDVSVGSQIEGKGMIKRSLCQKSVLVVLDDVNELEQLKALAGAYDWFGEGSRIIITTRDRHLLTLKNATICEASLLSDAESLKLFSRHAFQKDEPLEDYKPLSQEVVSYASRLPLALEVLGSLLYDQDKEVWKGTLAKLKRIPNPDVTKTLKISYDALEPDEKQLFLDIACFYRGVKIDWAMPVLESSNFEPRIGIQVLAQKSLIKVSEGRFDMHDLVEEMAHYIVRGEHHDYPEKYSRIWKEEDIENVTAMGAYVSETQIFILGDRNICIDMMARGKYLHIVDAIGNMKKLRCIESYGFPASTLPSNFQPTYLGCLKLTYSKLKQLWKGNKILPNLKILDLSDSKDLMTTPDFNGLPRLERLILGYCISLEEIHPSIGYHERLVYVDMRDCERLKTFPPIIRMKNLETLDLSGCSELHMFPDIQTNMDSLVNLHLKETGIEIIPPSVGQLQCLKFLNLSCCNNLVEVSHLPSSIAILIAEHCRSLQSVGDLSNCKWLWKVSFCGSSELIDVERLVHHMFQINSIRDHFMSIAFPCKDDHYSDSSEDINSGTNHVRFLKWYYDSDNDKDDYDFDSLYSHDKVLRLPQNWYDEFSGFLLFGNHFSGRCYVSIDDVNCDHKSPALDYWEKFDKIPEFLKNCGLVGYVPFASFKHPSWGSRITFTTHDIDNLRVGFVPRKSKSKESPIDYSESWKQEISNSTFVANNENEVGFSRIEIEWSPDY